LITTLSVGEIHRGHAGVTEVGSNVPVVGGIEQGSNDITPHQTSFITNTKHVYQPGAIKEQRKSTLSVLFPFFYG
jgi:hypothetical protein